MLDDNELINFPTSNLFHGEAGDGRRLLREHGDVYRAQLVAARWLDGWRSSVEELRPTSEDSEQFNLGIAKGLREVVAHLRQGDFLPGGTLYEDEVSGRNDATE